MKVVACIALIHALVLAGFSWLPPVMANPGLPERPDITTVTRDKAVPMPTPEPESAIALLPPKTEDYIREARNTVQRPPAGVRILEHIEQRIVALTDAERRKHGRKSVAHDDGLRFVARAHSRDMAARDYFDHTSLEGRTPGDRTARLHRRLVGQIRENIAFIAGMEPERVDDIAARFVRNWMESPGPRVNLLNQTNTHLGVGVAVKDGSILATQLFAEARGFLQEALPEKVRTHDRLNLRMAALSKRGKPQRYDFWLPERGLSPIKARPIDEAQVDMPPGTYRLRLYFVKEKKGRTTIYSVYNAPEIVVE